MLNKEALKPEGTPANPWQAPNNTLRPDHELESRIESYLNRMTLEEKVGQILQVEHTQVTPEDIRQFHFGSVLNGGNTVPGGGKYATAADAMSEANACWEASVDRAAGRTAIPIIWGTDAVHGHNNMVGSTIFPHNIGLGATANPEVVRDVCRATALEVLATGLDWTFAPSLAVAMNPRWGRFYESYSSDPALVSSLGAAAVAGLQGQPGSSEFLSDAHILACAKHFAGDGATTGGVDQGDAKIDEIELASVHAEAYRAAIEAGVQTIMASFSSWNGMKLHGHHYLLTEILKERWGFDGFVVGDWNGHGQIPGAANDNGAPAILAGVDMLMAPGPWQSLYKNTLAQVNDGVIPLWRLNDAVRRILRVKARAGVFDRRSPSERPFVLRKNVRGSIDHRQIARRAVRESLVLLKNSGSLLPLSPAMKIVIAGDCADDIGQQCGGWTLSWQGDGNTNSDFPDGTSILQAFSESVGPDGTVTMLRDPDEIDEADVAVVVFGESPYAEFQGDRDHIGYEIDHHPNLELIEKFSKAGIPVVGVFITGRPSWINRHINMTDAFVVAWLPGTEGAGIADVLIGGAQGRPRHDFLGRLPHDWPNTAGAQPGQEPLYPRGFGLTYADTDAANRLSEDSGLATHGTSDRPVIIFANGRLHGDFQTCTSNGTWENLTVTSQNAVSGALRLTHTSHMRQDDSLRLSSFAEELTQARISIEHPVLAKAESLTVRMAVRISNAGLSSVLDLGLSDHSNVNMLAYPNSVDDAWETIEIPLTRTPGKPDAESSEITMTLSLRAVAVAFSFVSIRCESSG